MTHWLKQRAWNPYIAGAMIGLLQIPALVWVDTFLGASSSYVTVGAWLAGFADSGAMGIEYLAKHVTPGKNFWQVALVAGIAVGAFVSSRLSNSRRPAVAKVWAKVATAHPWKRRAMAFAGGFIMLYGARMADGCTSGHGVSGMAQLAVSSTIAVATMFAGGMLVANLILRRM